MHCLLQTDRIRIFLKHDYIHRDAKQFREAMQRFILKMEAKVEKSLDIFHLVLLFSIYKQYTNVNK